MRELTSNDAVIDALGGPTKCGRRLGPDYAPNRVCNWRNNRLPLKSYDEIQAALAEFDCVASPDLWPDLPNSLKAQIRAQIKGKSEHPPPLEINRRPDQAPSL